MNEELIKIQTEYKGAKSVADCIYQTLKTAIIRGLLPSGFCLQDDDLAELFQVSRTPIKKALFQLEYDEMIKKEYSGYVVIKLEISDVINIMKILGELSLVAVRLALNIMDSKYILMLEKNIEKCEKITSLRTFYSADDEFHTTIVHSTGNGELLRAWNHIKNKIFLMVKHQEIENPEEIKVHNSYHRQIVDIIKSKEKIPSGNILSVIEEHNTLTETFILNAWYAENKPVIKEESLII